MSSFHHSVTIKDPSQAGEARRAVQIEARNTGFDETQSGKLAIVATEIATNIARHTRGGEVMYRKLDLPFGPAIEVVGIDRGPGMSDVQRCLTDGYSSVGTPGTGLGSIRRQSDEFDLYSTVEGGTVILSRVAGRRTATHKVASPEPEFAGICAPYPGQLVCGDAWQIEWSAHGFAIAVADGLGHGVLAEAAASAAMHAFKADPFAAPADVVSRIHHSVRSTRGCAVAVANFDARRMLLTYSGIGNIAGRLVNADKSRGLISLNGAAGVQAPKIQQFEYEWSPDTLLVMHTDGLQTRWQISNYPGLTVRHPGILAGVLYRDFSRGRDDITAVAVRWNERPSRG